MAVVIPGNRKVNRLLEETGGMFALAAHPGLVERIDRITAATLAEQLEDPDPPLVLDGPFAETKEQLLGFYVVDCKDLEEALAIARDLARANPGGSYEIRPVRLFLPGSGAA